MKLHRLKSEGLARFNGYLDLLASDGKLRPPTEILDDPETAEIVGTGSEVSLGILPTRMEAARQLHSLLAAVPNRLPGPRHLRRRRRDSRHAGLHQWRPRFFAGSPAR